MNDQAFQKAYEELKAIYEPLARAGHGDSRRSLNDLARMLDDREDQKALLALTQNPYAEKIIKSFTGRYIAICERQQGRTVRSEIEQKIDNLDKDWALFVISLLGGKAQEALDNQIKEIEDWSKRVRK